MIDTYDIKKSAFMYEGEVFEYEYFYYKKPNQPRQSTFSPIMIRVWCKAKNIDTGWEYSDNPETDGNIAEEALQLAKKN